MCVEFHHRIVIAFQFLLGEDCVNLGMAGPADANHDLYCCAIENSFVSSVVMSRPRNEMMSREPFFSAANGASLVHLSYSTEEMVLRKPHPYKISAPRGRVADGGLMFPPEQLVSRFLLRNLLQVLGAPPAVNGATFHLRETIASAI